ncbi:thiol-disulfide oxidoreductase DCC family protein [Micromonosporaceae bacterium Da 78-11]
MTEYADPAGHGAGRIESFTVLYDQGCPICRTAHRWLAGRAQLVPLQFVPAATTEARERFPQLDHAATLRDLTVIADNGFVYVGDAAWMACLWALADYRGMAERLTSPRLLPTARRFIAAASAVRASTRTVSGAGPDTREPQALQEADYGDGCDDRCR